MGTCELLGQLPTRERLPDGDVPALGRTESRPGPIRLVHWARIVSHVTQVIGAARARRVSRNRPCEP